VVGDQYFQGRQGRLQVLVQLLQEAGLRCLVVLKLDDCVEGLAQVVEGGGLVGDCEQGLGEGQQEGQEETATWHNLCE
jgi:hypothetical protein